MIEASLCTLYFGHQMRVFEMIISLPRSGSWS